MSKADKIGVYMAMGLFIFIAIVGKCLGEPSMINLGWICMVALSALLIIANKKKQ